MKNLKPMTVVKLKAVRESDLGIFLDAGTGNTNDDILLHKKQQTAEVKPLMEAAIKELEAWLDAEGALIGHVKGYIREGGPVTTFSTTGNGLNVEAHEGGGVAVGFAAIVFGPEEEVLKDKVLEVFKNL